MQQRRTALLCAFAATAASQAVPDPADVLNRAIGMYVSYPYTHDFWSYSYGAAIMADAAYRAVTAFGQPWTAKLDGRLNGFLADPASVAGQILANKTVKPNAAVGDGTGLYPIAFLAQLDLHGVNKSSDAWTVAVRTGECESCGL